MGKQTILPIVSEGNKTEQKLLIRDLHFEKNSLNPEEGRKDSLQSFKYSPDNPILQELGLEAGLLPIVNTEFEKLT